MRSDEFNQLLRKVAIEFFRSTGDCQWGGNSIVFGVRRFLGQDSGPDGVTFYQGDGEYQPTPTEQGHQFRGGSNPLSPTNLFSDYLRRWRYLVLAQMLLAFASRINTANDALRTMRQRLQNRLQSCDRETRRSNYS